MFGEIASVLSAVATVLLIAKDRHRATFAIAAGVLGTAVAGHFLLIPRLGALGAATVTAGAALTGAVTTTAMARGLWNLRLPVASGLRALALAVLGYCLAAVHLGSTWLIVPQIAAICLAVAAGLFASGELTATERRRLLGLLTWGRPA